jgi:hypothetical protein
MEFIVIQHQIRAVLFYLMLTSTLVIGVVLPALQIIIKAGV